MAKNGLGHRERPALEPRTLAFCAGISSFSARWCAPPEDDLPAVRSRRSRPDYTGDFPDIHMFLRKAYTAAVLFRHRQSLAGRFPRFNTPA